MKEKGLGVDVIINNIQENPCCTHGPTVLFERYHSNGSSSKYYACSACRDRRDCSFYHLADQKFSQDKEKIWKQCIEKANSKGSHSDVYKRSEAIKALPGMQRAYCLTCSELLGAKRAGHEECTLKTPMFDTVMSQPTMILPPRESAKFEAQYMFSSNSVDIIKGMIHQLKATKVLCLGTPRIYEAVTVSGEPMPSLLMDIDSRYCAFFSPSEFVRYNMFNHHFFDGEKSKKTYLQFITGDEKLVVVCDPPFGGRMELLAHNLRTIQNDWRAANKLSDESQLSVFFIFPYFLEPQVLEQLPNFVMLDYLVDYDNHPLYSSGLKGMIQGSAVRVYVNDRPSLFALPENKGYRFCDICDRWVRSTNLHCNKCNGCVSKDGRTYKHCDDCKKCVKPSWNHCSKCQKCQQQDHKCGDTVNSFSCHNCGKEGHKRSDCPNRKRSLSVSRIDAKNKKRKLNNSAKRVSQANTVRSQKSNKNKKNNKKKDISTNVIHNKVPTRNGNALKKTEKRNKKNRKGVLSSHMSNKSEDLGKDAETVKKDSNVNLARGNFKFCKKRINKKNSNSLSPKVNKENMNGNKANAKLIQKTKKSKKNKQG